MKTEQQYIDAIGDIGLAAHILKKAGDGVISMTVHVHGPIRVRVLLEYPQFVAMFPGDMGTTRTDADGREWIEYVMGDVEYSARNELQREAAA